MVAANELQRLSILLSIGIMFPALSHGRALDDAIDAQLESVFVIVQNIPCQRLLKGDDPFVALRPGGLQDICSRGVPGGTPPPTSASGITASTLVALPDIIKERMEEDESTDKSSVREVKKNGKSYDFFLSVTSETLNREITTYENGFDSNTERLTAGIDTQFGGKWFAGVAIDLAQQDSDFADATRGDIDSSGIILYGTYYPNNEIFLQFSAGNTQISTDRNRKTSFTDEGGNVTTGIPDADYDSDQYSAGVLFGYDSHNGNLTYGPRVSLDWVTHDYGTYTETGSSGLELSFHDDEQTSLLSSIGLFGSVAVSTSFGVVTVQGNLAWKHEFDNDQREVQVSFVDDIRANPRRFTYETEKPDRDYFEYSLGISFVAPNNLQYFFNAWSITDHSYLENYALSVGLRSSF